MSEYKIGSVIELNGKNYIIIKNFVKENNEYLLITQSENTDNKWEEITNFEDLKVDYNKIDILTHNMDDDSFRFERDQNIIRQMYEKLIKN